MNFRNSTFFISILLFLGVTQNVCALPQGGNVVAGNATISNTTNSTTVNTSSSKTQINWNSFSIAADESVTENQPSSSSVLLNKVIGIDPSEIYGTLSSNGQIFLVNPNGILFGPGSQVNAPGILASTLDMSKEDFLAGNYKFYQNKHKGSSYIINQGRLAATPGGYIALLSQAINNQGVIVAPLGTVALAAGDKLTLALDSQSQISVAVDDAVKTDVLGPNGQQINSAIQNSGIIKANGGEVLLTAKTLNDVFDYAVNNSGVIEAGSLKDQNGAVELVASGAPVINTGKIKANQNLTINSQNGIYSTGSLITPNTMTLISDGDIYSLGVLESSSLIERGNTFQIGGVFNPGYADVKNADNAIVYSANTSVSGVITDPANIVVDPDVVLTLDADTTFNAGNAFTMDPTATINGGGYNLSISALNASTLGNINNVNLLTLSLISGSTPVTFTSNSSSTFQVNTVKTNYLSILSRTIGTGTSYDPIIIYSDSNAPGGLQYISTSGLGYYYELANNIDASETSGWNSGAGFVPIGTFTGSFNGNNYAISNLFIYLPSTSNVGLFGYTSGATISNVGLINVNITGQDEVGGLVAENVSSTISSSYVTGSVTGTGGDYVGGLVGENANSSSISNSYAAVAVMGGSGNLVGGLVGDNANSSSITNSYATGAVSGSGGLLGGLVGYNYSSSTISNSYATGSVTGGGDLGGLVGYNSSSTISNSYATGAVTGGGGFVGGLVGENVASNIYNSYATGAVAGSGGNDVGGLVGYDGNSSSTISNSFTTGSVTGSGSNVGGLIGYEYGGDTLTNNWWYNSQTYGIGNNGTAQSTGNWQLASALSDFYGTGSGVGSLYSTWSFGVSSGWDSFTSTYPHLYWEWSPTITTLLQLQNINLDLSGSYTLANDLDATATEGWNAGAGFDPIGTSTTPFTGTFNGDNYTISNLFINLPTTNYVGLFGVTSGATISNVGLINVNITGQDDVGGLVGENYDSSISNSFSMGAVTGSGNAVGGLVGYNNYYSTVSNSYATGSVVGSSYVGGLVGDNYNNSSVSDSYATGSVTGSGAVGGLVGYNYYYSAITNSYAMGAVTGSGAVGGLVGENVFSTISDSYATGAVMGGGGSYIGGLVGENVNYSSISNSYATGAVTGGDEVGGLVGWNYYYSSISNAYATGAVTGYYDVGGLVGQNNIYSPISNAYATGAVTETGGSNNTGGLVGSNYNHSTISNSFDTGSVTSSGSYIGGLIGYDDGSNTLTNNWWYNSQSYGIGNNGTAQSTGNWQLASALSDFYSSSFTVYTGSTPWNFISVWFPPSSTYPLLR